MRADLGDAGVGYTDVWWYLLLGIPFQAFEPSSPPMEGGEGKEEKEEIEGKGREGIIKDR